MSALTFEGIGNAVRAAFPDVTVGATDNKQPYLLVPPMRLLEVARFLRDEPSLRFDALMDLFGFDLLRYPKAAVPDAIAVVLLLTSYQHGHRVALRALAPRADCRAASTSSVWAAAVYFERECWDLLGVHFDGHTSLQRIMTPDDWEGHPLRKDYVYPAAYHGIAHVRDGQHFEHKPQRQGDPPPAPTTTPAAPRGSHAP